MSQVVTYYFTPVSPWSYLGHERLLAVAAKHGATIEPRLMDLGKVFPVSGGLPLPKRSPQRQAYRLVELARWRDALGVLINLQPKFAASSGEVATRWILAAQDDGVKPALALAGAVMRSRWAEEGDIADEATLGALARGVGLDPARVAAQAAAPETAARYEQQTQQAIDAGVFGAPWYVCGGEPFWGQDRLDFLDRKLAK
jgi:2-hydroxychromene-2-carboxylate isomerase